MSVSIITPHYNDFEALKQIYSCLLKQVSKDLEWIIIDDFSGITVKELLAQYFQQKSNLGSGAANNTGVSWY